MLNYKFRLYPTHEQEQRFVETLDGCRWVYNYFYKREMSEFDMNYALVELKEQEPWLYNYHSKMLQMVGKQIATARKVLGTLKACGYNTGKLHYSEHDNYNSFTYNQSGFRIEHDRLLLSKIGSIKIVLHRQPVDVKQVTVTRQAGKWYAIVTCKIVKPVFKFINPRKSVGIDVGITKFSHDSDDHEVENPLVLAKMIRPLRRAHRRVSRKLKGSNNHAKSKSMLSRLHRRAYNKRRDFLHKLSTEYSRRYDVIFLERLRTLNMVKNRHVARYVLDSGWRTFKTMLEYKAKMVLEVEPRNTSIDCSRCGYSVPKSLAVRTHICDSCGLVLDRDHNASLNILCRGLSRLPVECREVTPVEIAYRSRKQETMPLGVGSSPIVTL